jgi:hypothetical protein
MNTENAAADQKAPRLTGRPPLDVSPECKESVIALTEQGKTLRVVADECGISAVKILELCENDPRFDAQYRRAQAAGLRVYADRLLTIADEEPDIQRAALHSRNWQWVLSRRLRNEYGDSVDVRVTERVDVGSILSEARARLRARTVEAETLQPLPVNSALSDETLQVLPVNSALNSPLADSIEAALR